jgi:hypothetical protein
MDCRNLSGAYELYLFGSLTGDDARHIEDHLQGGCACCQEQLREAALTVFFLCSIPQPARPAPKTKVSLMRRLKDSAPA